MTPATFGSTRPGSAPKLSNPFTSYGVTSGFGPRRRPMPGASTYHKGVDYGTPMGTPVTAPGAGKFYRRFDKGFGNYAEVRYPDGSRSVLAHLSGFPDLADGTEVTAGQQIGISGRSGTATGPHTHHGYYLPDGTPVDPRRYFGGR